MAGEFVAVPVVVLERLKALGVDVARVLRHAGIAPSRFPVPRARLSVPEFFAFWRAIEEVGGVADVGLRIGAEAEPHQLEVSSVVALHSETYGAALEKFARYKRLVCGERVSVDVVGKEARIGFHWVHADETPPLSLVDATFASLVALGRRGTGKAVTPVRIELARRKRAPALARHFGCPIQVDAPGDRLVLDVAFLAAPFVTHNADLLAFMVPALDAALGEIAGSGSIVDDVRRSLARSMAGERPSIDKVAAELGTSARSLQRRLREHGASYQELLDEVRRATSRRLLADTELAPSEVAFVVGFEEVNSFTRAFQQWEGTTPSRFRDASRSVGER